MPKVKRRKSALTIRRELRERRRLAQEMKSPQQIKLDRMLNAERARERRARLTPEEKAEALVRASEYTRRRRQNFTPEQRSKWREKNAKYQRERRAKMSPDTLARIRQRNAEKARIRRAALSEAQQAEMRRINTERARIQRANRLQVTPFVSVEQNTISSEQTVSDPARDFFQNIGLMVHRVLPPRFQEVTFSQARDEVADLMSSVKVEIEEGNSELEL